MRKVRKRALTTYNDNPFGGSFSARRCKALLDRHNRRDKINVEDTPEKDGMEENPEQE